MTVKACPRSGMSLLHRLRNLVTLTSGVALLVLSAEPTQAQDVGRVTGRVVSTLGGQKDDPVPGVRVRLLGIRSETETDDQGRFEFRSVPTGRYEILAEILGCQLGSMTVGVRPGQAVLADFSLTEPIIEIPGLVALGPATELPEFDLPYSVGRLDPAKLERHPGRSIADLIRGEFPGAKIVQGSGLAGEEISIQLRGRRSISTPQEPLIVVDGAVTGGGAIDLNPRDVEDIRVLKGSVAASEYGSRGQAGVIEITTGDGATRARTRQEPSVIVDGVLSPTGLDEVDPERIDTMELVEGPIARLLLGRGAPEAGLVRIRTRGRGSGGHQDRCSQRSGPSGQTADAPGAGASDPSER